MIAASNKHRAILGALIGSVWVFHGLWSKVLDQIPRHRSIVGRILGDAWAGHATIAIGVCEILLGVWIFSALLRRTCATVQTIALAAMNTLEILFARDLLISAPGMIVLNFAFLGLVWHWALALPAKS